MAQGSSCNIRAWQNNKLPWVSYHTGLARGYHHAPTGTSAPAPPPKMRLATLAAGHVEMLSSAPSHPPTETVFSMAFLAKLYSPGPEYERCTQKPIGNTRWPTACRKCRAKELSDYWTRAWLLSSPQVLEVKPSESPPVISKSSLLTHLLTFIMEPIF